jgi:hypothetical protein
VGEVPNPNPYKARLARAEKHAPGDIEAFRRRTWALLCLAYEDCGSDDAEQRRKGILAYSQIGALYLRTWEISEVQARLLALEQAQADAARTERNGYRA